LDINPTAYEYKGKVYNHLTAFYKYHPGATHKLHADTDKPGRVLTATLTLNEAGVDYDGGMLHIYDGFPKTKEAIEAYQRKCVVFGTSHALQAEGSARFF
jgi:predicted 2-oxoglutarate/Fe(II)-dependent dioxygenase YbiX